MMEHIFRIRPAGLRNYQEPSHAERGALTRRRGKSHRSSFPTVMPIILLAHSDCQ